MLRIGDEASVGSLQVTKLTFSDNSEFTSATVDTSALATKAELVSKADLASPEFTGLVDLPVNTTIGTVSSGEISRLSGVTSAIQTQLDGKATHAQLLLPAFKATGTSTGVIMPKAGELAPSGVNSGVLLNNTGVLISDLLAVPTTANLGSFEVNATTSNYASGIFTAPVAGIYYFYVNIFYGARGAGEFNRPIRTFVHSLGVDGEASEVALTLKTDTGGNGLYRFLPANSWPTAILHKATNFQTSANSFTGFSHTICGTVNLTLNERVGVFHSHNLDDPTHVDNRHEVNPSRSYFGGHLITR